MPTRPLLTLVCIVGLALPVRAAAQPPLPAEVPDEWPEDRPAAGDPAPMVPLTPAPEAGARPPEPSLEPGPTPALEPPESPETQPEGATPPQDVAALSMTVPHPAPRGVFLPPTFRGTGLLVSAGLVGAVGLIQHAIAVAVLNNTCGLVADGARELSMEEREDIGIDSASAVVDLAAFGVLCAVAAAPSITLRMNTPVFLGASMALAAGGGSVRGQYMGFRETFHRKKKRNMKVILGVGGGLLGAGLLLWSSSRLSLLRNRVRCGDLRCYIRYDFATLQLSAAMSISGASVLAFGLAYRKHHRRFQKLKQLQMQPLAMRGGGGFGVSVQF